MINKKMRIVNWILIISILLILMPLGIAQEVKFCCEKTKAGAWCQNDFEENCDSSYQTTPASCDATSFCKLGCCYDSSEGLCMENTPQKACNNDGGTWSDSASCSIPQCELGCCVLGKQASFVTLTRCKKLSGFYGLITDFKKNVGSELECIALASLADEGACVFDLDYQTTCTFTSRQECNTLRENSKTEEGSITGEINFYKDFLCSAEELATNCGPTERTTCVKGKDEVYFVDSCGNAANIYDSSKVEDKAYWKKAVSKADSCYADKDNINSKSCGNCNYFDGSICKNYKDVGVRPTHGENICADLDCHASDTSDGLDHKHGESWCSTDEYPDAVGSRYYRHVCMNSEETIEPCADFRQYVCIEGFIETAEGPFSQAACRVNRWQKCSSQFTKQDCENIDKGDCKWIDRREEVPEEGDDKPCVPLHPPGIEFWDEGESEGVCSAANKQCVQKWEKSLTGGKDCSGDCCDEEAWKNIQLERCNMVADCGAKLNFIGMIGDKEGYEIIKEKLK